MSTMTFKPSPLADVNIFRPTLLKSKRDRRTGLFPQNAPIVIREGRLIRDLTMPERDWSIYDPPAKDRRTSRVIREQRRG